MFKMKVLLLIQLLAITCVLLSETAIIGSNHELKNQIFYYQSKSSVVIELLAKECPEELKLKRQLTDELGATDLEVEKLHYYKLLQKLKECRQKKKEPLHASSSFSTTSTTPSPSTTTSTTTIPTTTTTVTTSTTTVTTTTIPAPPLCLSATNLTESWRLDHDGKDIRPGGPHSGGGYACDFRKNLKWFRFAGAAGKKFSIMISFITN